MRSENPNQPYPPYPQGPVVQSGDPNHPSIRVAEVADTQDQPREDYKEMPTREASPDMTNYNDSLALEVRLVTKDFALD